MYSLTATAPIRDSGPAVEIFTGDVDIVHSLAEEWAILCAGVYDQPFYRPEWIRAYVRAFAPGQELVLVTARVAGRLVAVLPLVRELGTLDGLPARKLRAAANAHTCRFDLVHRGIDTASVARAMWSGLANTSGWDVLELLNVPIHGAAGSLVRAARADGYATHAAPRARNPYLLLGQVEGIPTLERLDARFRANLRRRMRKLQAHGHVELAHTREADANLARFYELERAGWKGSQGSAIACSDATRRFYDAVAQTASAQRLLSVYSLECAGAPVAMHFGLEHGGRYMLLKTAYDESFRDCSPGQLLTYEVLRDLVTRGCSEFDFLGPMMEWKRAWRPRLRPHADWYVMRGAPGRLLHALRFRARPAVGRALRVLRARRVPD